MFESPHEIHRLMADTSPYAEMLEDERGAVLYASPACTRVFGYEPERFLAEPSLKSRLIHDDSRSAWEAHLEELAKGDNPHTALLRINHPDDSTGWVERQARVIISATGQRLTRSTSRQVSPAEESATTSCEYRNGSLTGLPGRSYCMLQLERLFESSRLDMGKGYGVIYVDIDQLKKINDTLGPTAGDLLIQQAAMRLHDNLPPLGDLMHLSGDEFVIILEKTHPRAVIRFVKTLQAAFRVPFDLDEQRITASASMGIVLSPVSYERPEDLLRNANIAVRRAKVSTHGFKVFHSRLLEESLRTTEIELDLPRGLEDGEFYLDYQPIINLENRVLTGFEALLRWDHPKWGVIRPTEFLPVAEATDFIVPLGNWVLARAMTEMQHLYSRRPDLAGLSVSINVSARQLNRYDFVQQVQKALEQTGFDPTRLKIEITETAAMADPELTAERLHALKTMGVEISLDDFGTGYSSLSYLQTLPVDTLKVDREFVSQMDHSLEKRKIVRSVISLAHNMNLTVVAEGVELSEQWSMLKVLDCHSGQGFLFSRPIDMDKIMQLPLLGRAPEDHADGDPDGDPEDEGR